LTQNNPLTRYFEESLARLGRYTSGVEAFLATEVEALDKRVTAGAELLSPDERQDHVEWYAEDFVELSEELPTTLRHSVLIAANSALEQYLDATCRAHIEVSKSPVVLRDIAGSGLQRAHRYLKKIAGIEFPDQAKAWVDVVRLGELRNCIIHAEGYVHESNAARAEWLGTFPGVRISADRTVRLDALFISEALTRYEQFGEAFDNACPTTLWRTVFDFEDVAPKSF
jgi:hypothetical protein